MTQIVPFRSPANLISLRDSESPTLDQDRLQTASTGRVVLETGSVVGAGTGVCLLLAVAPPVGVAVGGVMGAAWITSRSRSNRQVASYREGIDRFRYFQDCIAVAAPEEMHQIRAEIRAELARTTDPQLRFLCLSADVEALKTQVHLYKERLAGGIAAAHTEQQANTPHPAGRFLTAVACYAQNKRSQDRRRCTEEARDLAANLLTADFQAVERSADAVLHARDYFDKGDLVEMYYAARRLLLSKLSQQLRNHAFTAQEIANDPFVDDDDIQF